MLLSQRETILLTELINSHEPVSLTKMMSLLKVSKRTVYREVDNLEQSLASIGASLEKVSRGKFQVLADEAALKEIQLAILGEDTQELSATSRQHAILLEMLVTLEPLSLQYFMDKYVVSNTTFYADVKQIEDQLEKLPLSIVRNMGYEINGVESQRRLLIANILTSEINEYQFFHSADTLSADNAFFQFIKREQVQFAQTLIHEEVEAKLPQLSDRKLQFMVLILQLSMQRTEQGKLLADDEYSMQVNKEQLAIAKNLFTRVAMATKQLYAVSEILFFANVLNDFANSFDQDFFDDSFDTSLAYSVKRLIELVSQETKINFFEDASLYKMLLTHLSGVFTRAVLQEKTLSNPILERIMTQYPEIVAALRKSLPTVFQTGPLSEEEIAYMVLHFASSLERNPQAISVNVAGISPSGLASTSMLEMRLRRYFPFINQIDFYRMSELTQVDLASRYDLVISTALLPGYTGTYQLVSPLLMDDEIKQLKAAFQEISRNKKVTHETKQRGTHTETYGEVVALLDEINRLLSYFFVTELANAATISETLEQVLARVPKDVIVDSQIVKQKLLDRYKQAPIGIPKTKMALFHTWSEAVSTPCFAVFDLAEPLTILGMDKAEMQLTRLLLMVAPLPLDETMSKILGKISGAIIMNDLNLEIFNSGNQAIIYQLLQTLLIEEIKN
jgi:mannitol operon transcriptional antiterminator